MARKPTCTSYVTPLQSNGAYAPTSASSGRGWFTLAAGTYYVPLGGHDADWLSAMSQWGATGTITSITVEETDAPQEDVSDFAASAGNWFAVDAARITSAVNGAGTSANTNDVLAHSVAGAGGGIQDIQDQGARRTRLVVVVATQVDMRFYAWAKE